MLSSIFPPTECSAHKSGSVISLKKMANGTNRTSVNMENNEEFEFEFAMDSDGFIKNKDYRLYNYQPKSAAADLDGEDEYDEYDDYDEDTMDVEDLPEDADFEWCWDDAGNLKIYEIDKVNNSKQAEPEQVTSGSNLDCEEKASLAWSETEVAFPSVDSEDKCVIKNRGPQNGLSVEACSTPILEVNPHNLKIFDLLPEPAVPVLPSATTVKPSEDNQIIAVTNTTPDAKSECESRSRSKSASKTRTIAAAAGLQVEEENADASTSSRRARKRNAQITPPPAQEEKNAKSSNGTPSSGKAFTAPSAVPAVPLKTAKQDTTEVGRKMGKIASLFERQPAINGTNEVDDSKTRRSKKIATSCLPGVKQADIKNSTRKPVTSVPPLSVGTSSPASALPRTQVVEVFEFDPLLGYCTVKRKTIPIVPTTTLSTAEATGSSINLSFLQSTLSSTSSENHKADIGDPEAGACKSNVRSNQTREASPQNKEDTKKLSCLDNNLSENGHVEEEDVARENMSSSQATSPSSSSAKENKVPNMQAGSSNRPSGNRLVTDMAQSTGEPGDSTPSKAVAPVCKPPLVPLSSITKYDIPFLGQLLAANIAKPLPSTATIPEPPKCKPPSLPLSVGGTLPPLPAPPVARRSLNNSNISTTGAMLSTNINKAELKEEKAGSTAEIDEEQVSAMAVATKTDTTILVTPAKSEVDIDSQKSHEVTVTVSKLSMASDKLVQETSTSNSNTNCAKTQNSSGKSGGEKEWYWDYDDNCWKECDPDEYYEWEYIESDDENEVKNKNQPQSAATPSIAASNLEATTAASSMNKRSSSLQSLKEEANSISSNNTCKITPENTCLNTEQLATGTNEKNSLAADWRNRACK
jgi:hypothetical protein